VLASQRLDPARLAVVGYGEQRPAASNDTPEGRNANRRVVVVILAVEPQNEAPATAPSPAPGTLAEAPPGAAPGETVQSAASPVQDTLAAAPPAAAPAAQPSAAPAAPAGADGGH